jgi:O-antigen ligase
MHQARQARRSQFVSRRDQIPPPFIEYAYYLSVLYAVAGVALGVSVPLLGAGVLAVLAVVCVDSVGPRRLSAYSPIVPALACAASSIAVQIVVHHESLMSDYVRSFVNWVPALIVVQSVSLRRGFLHRFAIATFGIGLITLPFSLMWSGGGVERLALDSTVGLSNPNDLAGWFGFCAVYFIVRAAETKQPAPRTAALLGAVASVYVVGLTVSRGKLLGVAVAAAVALRHLLRRGFLLVLLLLIIAWVIYSVGLFDRITTSYVARGTQETGRLLVWPLAFERFIESPLTGVGGSNISTQPLGADKPVEPHNGLLHIALASGIGPLLFFVAYWLRAFRKAFAASREQLPDGSSVLPLLVYCFLMMSIGNATFMFSWMLATVSAASTAGTGRRTCPVPRRASISTALEHARSRYEMRRHPARTYLYRGR